MLSGVLGAALLWCKLLSEERLAFCIDIVVLFCVIPETEVERRKNDEKADPNALDHNGDVVEGTTWGLEDAGNYEECELYQQANEPSHVVRVPDGEVAVSESQ